MKIGIDFGTTNTAVSLYLERCPIPFKFGVTQESSSYIPSLFALSREDEERFGHAAKRLSMHRSWRVFRNFKMLLEEIMEIYKDWGYTQEINPEFAMKKFFRYLFSQLTDQGVVPSTIVVTVPHVWTTTPRLQPKRERLIYTLQEILPNTHIQVEEEPIAAATYYLFSLKKEHRHNFNGYLVICDCGGGTMDFCLVRSESPSAETENSRVTILGASGQGQMRSHLGGAGVAYDEAVIRHLFPQELEPARRIDLLRAFESGKIALWETNEFREKVDECLNEKEWLYGTNILFDDLLDEEPLFCVEGEPVTLRLMIKVFKEVIVPGLVSSLDALEKEAASNGVNVREIEFERLRIVFVGGFSQFYLIEKTIRIFFNSASQKDQRFVKPKEYEGVLSISNGAALIAGKQIEIQKECPVEVGVCCVYYWGIDQVLLLKKGEDIQLLKSPTFSGVRFLVRWNDSFRFTFYVKKHDIQNIIVDGKEIVQSIFSRFHKRPDESIFLYAGLSVDQDLRFFIHFRENLQSSEETKHSLGQLISLVQKERIP